MKREKKAEIFNEWKINENLNVVKDRIYDASEYLHEEGLHSDAEQLMKIVFRIEAFQNKYR